MNRNGPCQFQRELPESTFNIFHNLLAFLVQYVFCVCPLLFLQQEGSGAIFGTHFDAVGGKVGDFTDHTVIVAVLAGRVVLYKHHLSAFFQLQEFVRGI